MSTFRPAWVSALALGCQMSFASDPASGTHAAEDPRAASPPHVPTPPEPPPPPDGNVEPPPTIQLTSPAFKDGHPIPRRHTCEGKDVSPPLEWARVPPEAASLVVMVDHTVPRSIGQPLIHRVHWLLYNLPPTTTALPEGVTADALPLGTRLAKNHWHHTEYRGPCPPAGPRRYLYQIFALDQPLDDLDKPHEPALRKAMAGHIVTRGELAGTYKRQMAQSNQ